MMTVVSIALSQVSSVGRGSAWDDLITSYNPTDPEGPTLAGVSRCRRPVMEGNIVCLLKGALRNTIIRLHRNQLAVIRIAVGQEASGLGVWGLAPIELFNTIVN